MAVPSTVPYNMVPVASTVRYGVPYYGTRKPYIYGYGGQPYPGAPSSSEIFVTHLRNYNPASPLVLTLVSVKTTSRNASRDVLGWG